MKQGTLTPQDGFGLTTGWLEWLNVAGIALLLTLAALALTLLLLPDSAAARRLRDRVPSLRGRYMTSLLLVSTVPLLSLSLVLLQRDMQRMFDGIGMRLATSAEEVASAVTHTMDRNLTGIISLASHISLRNDRSHGSMELWLSSHHATNPDFLTMLAADKAARVIAATHRVGGQVRPFGRTLERIADRDYFVAPITNGLPFVSDVFQGRGLGKDPIVAISAPLFDAEGDIWGIVEGSLDLRVFAEYGPAPLADAQVQFVLLDERNRVIHSSANAGLAPLSELTAHPIMASGVAVSDGLPFLFSMLDGHGKLGEYLSTSQSLDNGWKVILYSSVAPLRSAILFEFWVAAAWLVFAIFVALVLTFATASSTSRPLRELEAALEAAKIDVGAEFPPPSHVAPREIQLIHRRIEHAVSGLQRKNRQLVESLGEAEKLRTELSESLASRDQAIQDQTRELREANMALHLLNRTDSLTGLANRQGFNEFLGQVWSLATREASPVSVVCLDIDHFKAFNDHYGHPAGDRCLKKVAAAASDCAARPLDHLARTGGEEFVAVLGDTGLPAAVMLAERMRKRIEDLDIAHAGADGDARVTVSIGVASIIPAQKDAASELIELGDKALYAAKNGGRNRVAYADHGSLVMHEPAVFHEEPTAPDTPKGPVIGARPASRRTDNIVPMRGID